MKNINLTHRVLRNLAVTIVFVLLSIPNIYAQVIGTELGSIGYNGKIAIRVTDMSILSTHFTLNNGSIDLDFYFGPEDPRNGTYTGAPIPQTNEEIYIRFGGLSYQEGDSLTFIATELLGTGTTKHYVFVRGDYFPESGGPINVCPRYFTCDNFWPALTFYFDPSDIILDPSSVSNTSIKIEIPSSSVDILMGGYLDVTHNAIVLYFVPNLNCSLATFGTTTITINEMTCTFENGQLTCPPWADIPDGLNSTCAPYFENCTLDLIYMLSDLKYTLPCRQWIDFNQCTTTSSINRPGRVAIGTSNFAPDAALTVKNGIITDKVKVTDTGWADYVFEKDYPLMPLEEVEAYIAKYHHLPGTPSGKEVEAAGSFELGETTINHQVKIEEIFLHLIKLEEETKLLEAELFLYETLNKIRIRK